MFTLTQSFHCYFKCSEFDKGHVNAARQQFARLRREMHARSKLNISGLGRRNTPTFKCCERPGYNHNVCQYNNADLFLKRQARE